MAHGAQVDGADVDLDARRVCAVRRFLHQQVGSLQEHAEGGGVDVGERGQHHAGAGHQADRARPGDAAVDEHEGGRGQRDGVARRDIGDVEELAHRPVQVRTFAEASGAGGDAPVLVRDRDIERIDGRADRPRARSQRHIAREQIELGRQGRLGELEVEDGAAGVEAYVAEREHRVDEEARLGRDPGVPTGAQDQAGVGRGELDAERGQEQPVGVQRSADAGAGGLQDEAAAALHVDRVGRAGETAEAARHLDPRLPAGDDAVDAQVLLGADQDMAARPRAQRAVGRDREVHRLRLAQGDDARVVRVVDLGVAAFGRGQRGALGLAQGVDAGGGVDHQVRTIGADVAVGDERDLAADDVGFLDRGDGVGDLLDQACADRQQQLRLGPARAAGDRGTLGVGGDVAEILVEGGGVAADLGVQRVVLRAAVGGEGGDLGVAHARIGEHPALGGGGHVLVSRVVGRAAVGLAAAELPVQAVVVAATVGEGGDRLLCLGIGAHRDAVVRVGVGLHAQAQLVPQRGELVLRARVDRAVGVVVDRAAAGADAHVARARLHADQQQIAGIGACRRRVGVGLVGEVDVAARARRQAVAGEHVGVEAGAVAAADAQRRAVAGLIQRADAAVLGDQVDAPRLHQGVGILGEDVAGGLQGHPVHPGAADAAHVQVAHHLVEVDRAAGGVGMDHAAFELANAQGLLRLARGRRAADAGAGRQLDRAPADGGGRVALRQVAVGVDRGRAAAVVEAAGEHHVADRVDGDAGGVEADVLDRDRVVGAYAAGDRGLVAGGDEVLHVVRRIGAQGPPVALLPARPLGDGPEAIDRGRRGHERVRVGQALHAQELALQQRIEGVRGGADPVLVLHRGRGDAEPAVLRVQVLVGAHGVEAGGHHVAQVGRRRVGIDAAARLARRAREGARRARHRVATGVHRQVGDDDPAFRAAPGVERVHPQGLAAVVTHLDLAVAVEHAQLAAAGLGVEDLPEQLDVAALHLHAGELQAVLARVVVDRHLRPLPLLRGREAAHRGVGELEELGAGLGARARVERFVPGLRRGEVDAAAVGQLHLGLRGDVHAPLGEAALDGAVDVEVARRDQHAAVGDDAAAAAGVLHDGAGPPRADHLLERRGGHVGEAVGVALHEVAVEGLHLDAVGRDRRGLLEPDAAGLAVDADQAAQVGDRVGEHDVGGHRRHAGADRARGVGVVERIEAVLDQDGGGVAARLGGDDPRERGRARAAVDRGDAGVVAHLHAVEDQPATRVRGDLELAQSEEGRPLVDDVDAGVARRVELAGAGEAVGAHVDVAQPGHAVADAQELRLQAGAAGVAVVAGGDALADLPDRGLEAADLGVHRGDLGILGVERRVVERDLLVVGGDRAVVGVDGRLPGGDLAPQGGEIGRVVVVVRIQRRDLRVQSRDLVAQRRVLRRPRAVVLVEWLVERGDLALDRGLLGLQLRARGAQAAQLSIERAHAVLGHLARIAVVEAGLVRVAAEAHLVEFVLQEGDLRPVGRGGDRRIAGGVARAYRIVADQRPQGLDARQDVRVDVLHPCRCDADAVGLLDHRTVVVDVQALPALDAHAHGAADVDRAVLAYAGASGAGLEGDVAAAEEVAEPARDRRQGLAVDVLADAHARGARRAFHGVQGHVAHRGHVGAGSDAHRAAAGDEGVGHRVAVNRDRGVVEDVGARARAERVRGAVARGAGRQADVAFRTQIGVADLDAVIAVVHRGAAALGGDADQAVDVHRALRMEICAGPRAHRDVALARGLDVGAVADAHGRGRAFARVAGGVLRRAHGRHDRLAARCRHRAARGHLDPVAGTDLVARIDADPRRGGIAARGENGRARADPGERVREQDRAAAGGGEVGEPARARLHVPVRACQARAGEQAGRRPLAQRRAGVELHRSGFDLALGADRRGGGGAREVLGLRAADADQRRVGVAHPGVEAGALRRRERQAVDRDRRRVAGLTRGLAAGRGARPAHGRGVARRERHRDQPAGTGHTVGMVGGLAVGEHVQRAALDPDMVAERGVAVGVRARAGGVGADRHEARRHAGHVGELGVRVVRLHGGGAADLQRAVVAHPGVHRGVVEGGGARGVRPHQQAAGGAAGAGEGAASAAGGQGLVRGQCEVGGVDEAALTDRGGHRG